MRNFCRGLFLGLATLGLLHLVNPAAAQVKGDLVKIPTIDGVELHGLFYPSGKKDAPTIIVLHNIGDAATTKKSYTNLAETLSANYSVMLFDFRGHGRSKDIDAEKFWKEPWNAKFVKGGPKKANLELADIINKEAYYPAMVNDIAAVKAWLDRKNDAGVCNTSSTIVIGSEAGATLGAIWVNSQWHLHRVMKDALTGGQPMPHSEGKDVIACIWLSISPTLGGKDGKVDIAKTLDKAVGREACPTVFMYGAKDTSGMNVAKAVVKKLVPNPKTAPKKFLDITDYPVEGGEKLKGIDLLQSGLKTDKVISDWLESIVAKKGNEWSKRDFSASAFLWKLTPIPPFPPAKNFNALDMNNLLYQPYERAPFLIR